MARPKAGDGVLMVESIGLHDVGRISGRPSSCLSSCSTPSTSIHIMYIYCLECSACWRGRYSSVDLWYLHAPDCTTPFEEMLKGVNDLFKEAKFKRFGLSIFQSYVPSPLRADDWSVDIHDRDILRNRRNCQRKGIRPADGLSGHLQRHPPPRRGRALPRPAQVRHRVLRVQPA